MGSRIGARYRSLVRDDGGGFAGAVARLRFDFQTALGKRPRSRGSMRPRFASNSPTFGEEGAGKAGCRLHPWVPCKKSTGVGPQVNRKQPGLPCAMVYDLLRALPGDRALLPPSLHGMIPQNLAPASGRQDDTTSPSPISSARLPHPPPPPH